MTGLDAEDISMPQATNTKRILVQTSLHDLTRSTQAWGRVAGAAVVFSAFLAGVTACAGGGPAAPPTPIEVRVARVFPKTKAINASLLSVKLELYNPRSTPIKVGTVRYALDTKGVAGILEGEIDAGANLASEQQAELGFDVEVPLPSGNEALTALLEQDMVPADLTGQVVFGDGSISGFEKKTGLAVPTPPKFVVYDAQAAQYEKKGVDVTFFLRLVNENPFTLQVQGVSYTVTIAGKQMRSDEAGVGARLTAGAAEEYEVSTILDGKTFDDIDGLLRSGVVDYRVKGEITTRDMKIPFDHQAKIDLGSAD